MNIKTELKKHLKQKYPTAKISILTGGHHNINFKIEDKNHARVLRAPKSLKKASVQELIKETTLHKLVGSEIAPKLYSHYQVQGIPVIETRFIPGEHKELSKLKASDLERFGRFLAKLHKNRKRRFDPGFTTFGKYQGTHLDYFKRNLRETVYCYEPLYKNNSLMKEALKRLKETLRPKLFFRKTFSLIHGDLCNANIIWNKNEIRFIDWSDVRYADPVDELAYTKAINNISSADTDMILKSYTKHVRDRDILNRFYTYELKNRIFDVGWALGMIDKATTKADKKLYQKFYDIRAKNLQKFLQ